MAGANHSENQEKTRTAVWRSIMLILYAQKSDRASPEGVERVNLMIDIGRLYVKTAGREAGKYCTVVDTLEKNVVLIDGQVRRKKCNLLQLEPLDKTLDLKKGASHADVVKAFEKLGMKITATKPKTKKGPKPAHQRKKKEQPQQQPSLSPKKVQEKEAKKEEKPMKKESKKK